MENKQLKKQDKKTVSEVSHRGKVFFSVVSSLVMFLPSVVFANVIADAKPISEILHTVLQFLVNVLGIVSVVMLVIVGTWYVAAGGSSRMTDGAKTAMKNVIIGLIIALCALVTARILVGLFA